jgi:hypothetical protein
MSYILIMYIYAGPFAKGDSVALTTAGEFTTEEACTAAGDRGNQLVKDSYKSYRYVCLPKK